MADLLKPSRLMILLLLVSFATVSAVFFTPALPDLARSFQISESLAQWSMTIFLIGYTIGQLPYGPIANRFGRKKTIFFGIALALVGTLLAFSATAFWMLCLGRFIQALGSAVGLKISFTMIGDQHAGAGATKAFSLLTLAFGIMPGLGIAVGGFITMMWGWKGCFVFLALYSVLLGLLCTLLPETAKELDREALQVKKIAHGYLRQFKDPFTTLHALLVGLSTSAFYIFAAVAPYLIIDYIGLTPGQYGLWNLVPSLGFVCGTLIAHRLAERQRPRINMLSGILLVLIGLISMTFWFSKNWVNAYSLFLSMFIIIMGTNLLWINASSKGLSEARDKSNASAVMSFINIGMATLGSLLVSLFSPLNVMLLPIAFAILLILMLAIWFKLREHHQKSPD